MKIHDSLQAGRQTQLCLPLALQMPGQLCWLLTCPGSSDGKQCLNLNEGISNPKLKNKIPQSVNITTVYLPHSPFSSFVFIISK